MMALITELPIAGDSVIGCFQVPDERESTQPMSTQSDGK
jgi:hypothetical protein